MINELTNTPVYTVKRYRGGNINSPTITGRIKHNNLKITYSESQDCCMREGLYWISRGYSNFELVELTFDNYKIIPSDIIRTHYEIELHILNRMGGYKKMDSLDFKYFEENVKELYAIKLIFDNGTEVIHTKLQKGKSRTFYTDNIETARRVGYNCMAIPNTIDFEIVVLHISSINPLGLHYEQTELV